MGKSNLLVSIALHLSHQQSQAHWAMQLNRLSATRAHLAGEPRREAPVEGRPLCGQGG